MAGRVVAGATGGARRMTRQLAVNLSACALYGHAFSSMIMAGLWALALACYIAGAILALRR
jgi:hypothetical protein